MAPNLTTLPLRHDIVISSAQSIPTAFRSKTPSQMDVAVLRCYKWDGSPGGVKIRGPTVLIMEGKYVCNGVWTEFKAKRAQTTGTNAVVEPNGTLSIEG